jgi:hypothetical protein
MVLVKDILLLLPKNTNSSHIIKLPLIRRGLRTLLKKSKKIFNITNTTIGNEGMKDAD